MSRKRNTIETVSTSAGMAQAAALVIQPRAQVGGLGDQLDVAPAARADGVGHVDGQRVTQPAPPRDRHAEKHN